VIRSSPSAWRPVGSMVTPVRLLRVGLALSLTLSALAACDRPVVVDVPRAIPREGPPSEPASPLARPGAEELGLASWYGPPHHRRATASGEVFDMHDLTAAHRTLPFGTRVLVVHQATERSVEVRITDRGPFGEGRIIDLSYAAASALGTVGSGVAPVRVRVVALPSRADPSPLGGPAPRPPAFTVQVGSFSSRARAAEFRAAIERETGLRSVDIDAAVAAGETVHRVRVGLYRDRDSAREAARYLAERGYPGFVSER
jgi:rare lipoprotein A